MIPASSREREERQPPEALRRIIPGDVSLCNIMHELACMQCSLTWCIDFEFLQSEFCVDFHKLMVYFAVNFGGEFLVNFCVNFG